MNGVSQKEAELVLLKNFALRANSVTWPQRGKVWKYLKNKRTWLTAHDEPVPNCWGGGRGNSFGHLSHPPLLVLPATLPRELPRAEPDNPKGILQGLLHTDDGGVLPDVGPAGA